MSKLIDCFTQLYWGLFCCAAWYVESASVSLARNTADTIVELSSAITAHTLVWVEGIDNTKGLDELEGFENGLTLDQVKFYADPKFDYHQMYDIRKGLEKGFENLKDKLMKKNDEKYADMLIKLIKEFEEIYSKKKSRVKRVNKNKLIIEISN